jgi:hypothetical protein
MKAIEIKKEFEEKFLEAAKASAVQVRKKKLVKNSKKVCYELVFPFTQMDIFKVGFQFARLME